MKTMKKLNLKERIGIDRTVIEGFVITDFDEEKFVRYCEELDYTYQAKHCNESILNFYDRCYEQISVQHDCFIGGGFKIIPSTTTDQDGNRYDIIKSTMDLTINSGHNNLQNLTAQEYQNRIYDIFEYMSEEMGITCDPCDVMFKRLEINATFKVRDEFYRYEDCLHLIYGNLPSAFRDKKYDGGVSYGGWFRSNPEIQKRYLETTLAKNDTRELKIYNKISHLKEVSKVLYDDEDVMRIEYTLKRSRDIKRELSTKEHPVNNVFEVTDDDLYRVYMKFFRKDIIKPYEIWTEENHDELLRTVQIYQATHKQWARQFARYCFEAQLENHTPLLFDNADMKQIIAEIEPNKKQRSLKYQRFCKQAINGNTGNREHMNEIIDKVLDIEKTYQKCKTKLAS